MKSKIEFIKAVREFSQGYTGVPPGLKECKDFADTIWAQKRVSQMEALRALIRDAKKSGITEDEIIGIAEEYVPF